MYKFFVSFIVLTNVISSCLCLGITNYTKYNNYYVIDIASEDVKSFKEKLYNILINIKSEFSLIIIKVILSTIAPYTIFIVFMVLIGKRISIKFFVISYFIISICDIYYISYIWNNYKLGIKSAGNAINGLDIAMKNKYTIDPRKSNFEDNKYKLDYLGDEIKKYGIHAMFCEIPGTLPSNNTNPLSYSYTYGNECYNYDSQRRFLDPKAYTYVGEDKSQKYKKLQINKVFDLF